MLITHETAQFIFKLFVYLTVLGFIIYIPRLLYYVDGFKKIEHLDNPIKNRLAVLVPARNETEVVHVMDSLENQTYEHKYFDSYIIVQNKKDPAINLCKKYQNMNSIVVENQTCKGDALDGALQKIMAGRKKYSGYIIVDADNVVDKNFVLEMNNSLASGCDIILGKRCVKNFLYDKKYRNWISNCNGMIYTFLDKLGNAFRTKHKMHASVCGTGIMITSNLINELGGWPYRFVTEDFEFAIASLLNEKSFYYYEPAITYTEETMSHKSANDRRKRWLLGYAQVTSKYRKSIVQKYHDDKKRLNTKLSADEFKKVRGNLFACFDFLYSFYPLILIFAPAAIASFIFGLSTLISCFSYEVFSSNTIFFAKKFFITLIYLYGVLFVYTGIGLLADRKAIKISIFEKLIILFVNPFYISEYVGFFFWSFYKLAKGNEDTTWVSVSRIEDKPTKQKKA